MTSKISCMVLCAAALSACALNAVQLRGYGDVSAKFSNGEVVFSCESVEKADVLRSKLVADLKGMGAMRATDKSGVLTYDDGREIVVGRKGKKVVVRNGGDKRALDTDPVKKHPKYLDFFDLRALKFYALPGESKSGYGSENHWSFAKEHNINGLVYHSFGLESTYAPGVVNWGPTDFEISLARKDDGMAVIGATFGAALPLWLYNENPKSCAKIQDSTIVTEWVTGVHSGNFESYGKGFDKKTSPVRAFQKSVMERYVNDPEVGGWQLYRGAPIGDQLGRGMDGVLWDSSPSARARFKEWLKEHYSLSELGRRWKGDAKAYKNWDAVPFCQMMDLIGGDYDEGRFLLSKFEWEWCSTPKEDLGKYPTNGLAWVKFRFRPSQRLQFLDVDSAYYRLSNVPAKWFTGKTGKTLYLKATCFGYDNSVLNAWVNGKAFKSDRVGSHSTKLVGIEIPAGTFKGDGTDEIIFQTPFGSRGDGRIHGPISISLNPAQKYPYADVRVNARYRDLVDFERDMLKERNVDMMRYARHIDSQRPMSISGADWDLFGRMMGDVVKYGFNLQTTSIDAFYWPQLSDWGRLYGYYYIAEPSGPLKERNVDRVLGEQYYMGAGASAIFMDIEQYMKLEDSDKFLSRRDGLLKHFAHYVLDDARVGMLCTTHTHNDGRSILSFGWNLSRGDLQCAHCPSSMLTENDLINGAVTPQNFPVIFDASSVMSEASAEAVKKYVADGGTFVALGVSGSHSDLRENARVLDELTGFEATEANMNGKITFEQDETVFPLWAGKTMSGRGRAAFPLLCRLTAKAADAQVVARWADGSAAIGARNYGKGRVIVLGTDFHRLGTSQVMKQLAYEEPKVLVEMLEQLGVKRDVKSSSPVVWVRKGVVKTGLEDWVVAVNVAEKEPFEREADIEWAVGERPIRVIEATSGKSVDFEYENGVCRVKGVKFAKLETKIFASVRKGDVESAMKVWWLEKCKYWKGCAKTKEVDPVAKASPTHSIEKWEKAGDGIWCHSFRVPRGWKGKRVKACFNGRRAVVDKAVFRLNGKEFARAERDKIHPEFNGIFAYDVTELLNFDDENVVEAETAAGIGDTVYFETERTLEPEVSLNGEWDCVKRNFIDSTKVAVPGKFWGKNLRRKFFVPKEWKGKQVFLRVETPTINLAAVVINDCGKSLTNSLAPWGLRTEINVTEFLKFGEENTIELWHRHTTPTNYIGVKWNWPKESSIAVDNVVIGPVK